MNSDITVSKKIFQSAKRVILMAPFVIGASLAVSTVIVTEESPKKQSAESAVENNAVREAQPIATQSDNTATTAKTDSKIVVQVKTDDAQSKQKAVASKSKSTTIEPDTTHKSALQSLPSMEAATVTDIAVEKLAATKAVTMTKIPEKARADVPPLGLPELSTAIAQFTGNWMKASVKAHKKGENTAFSPASLMLALAMAGEGANGENLAEIAKVLTGKDDITNKEKWPNFSALDSLLRKNPQSLAMANAFLHAPSFELLPKYKVNLEQRFNAATLPTEFSSTETLTTVNKWFADNTAGKINPMLSQLPPATRYIIANAMYFKGSWEQPFFPEKTKSSDFNLKQGKTVKVAMMHSTMAIPHQQTKNWQYASLTFENEEFDLVLALPNKVLSYQQAVKKMGDAEREQWLSIASKKPKLVDIALPKFDLTAGGSVKETLKGAGVNLAFSGGDFSDMTNEIISVDDIIHKASLRIDEQGAEASAATAIMGVRSAIVVKNPQLVFDKPFFAAVVHRSSGLPVVLAWVAEPDAVSN